MPPGHRPRVCSFESRRQTEVRQLLERAGVEAVVAPSLREVPIDDSPDIARFAEELLEGRIDVVVFLTGVGARALREAVARFCSEDRFLAELRMCAVVVRGPKPTAVMREWGVPIFVRAAEPNTWRELVAAIDDSRLPVEGRRIAIQEYGQANPDLCQALAARGALVLPVAIYRWSLPDDVRPLEVAIRELIDRGFDALMFTSAQQIRHVQQVAESLGLGEAWMQAAHRSLIASIGPTCTEALQEAGLEVGLEPTHPHLGHLVRETVAKLR